MSGLIGIVGGAASRADFGRMLHGMAVRGIDRAEAWRRDAVLLGVGRYEWEMSPGLSDGTLVLTRQHVTVVADASLYDLDSLASKLRDRDVGPGGSSATHWILAAYLAWGWECASHLAGDFAFVLWDAREKRLIAARSAGGKRPLFVAGLNDGAVIASSIGAILHHPDISTALNPTAIASAACGLPSVGGPETAYQSIRRVAAGETIVWEDQRLRHHEHWRAPAIGSVNARADFQAGAEDLRELLHEAVGERMAPNRTAVWLSGGWDSSTIWAIGNDIIGDAERRRLHAVSISYPPGDPGREDEYIDRSVRHWRGRVSWVDIRTIPMFDRLHAAAESRDEPFAHMFERWNGSLSRASRECGARVALDGFGGDQLFQASELYFFDLLRSGRWPELWHDWRCRGFGNARKLGARVVRPALRMAGRDIPWHQLLLRQPPPWLRGDFADRAGLEERQRELLPPPTIREFSGGETFYFLTSPFYALVNQVVSEIALREGVESRSPLFDERIVRFAAGRPRCERASGRETKRLLRAAVCGLLPSAVLEPRPTRTGITSAYAEQSMTGPFQGAAMEVLKDGLILEELGIIDGQTYRTAVQSDALARDGNLRVSAFLTLQAELWLRTRQPAAAPAGTRHLLDASFGVPAAVGATGCSEPAARDEPRRPHVREA